MRKIRIFVFLVCIGLNTQSGISGNSRVAESKIVTDNIFTRFFDWLGDLARPVHGKFKIDGKSDAAPPLALLDKRSLLGINLQVQEIANNIKNIDALKILYKDIFEAATNTETANCTNENAVCENAAKAKNAAFVYLLGIDLNGDTLNENTSPTRDFFRQQAVDVLKNIDTYDAVFPVFGNGRFGYNKQQRRSKELLQYLAALDLLRTGRQYLGLTLSESDEIAIQNKLAAFTRNLYARALGSLGVFKTYSNYSLMTSGALGASSCILSERGTYFWEINAKPKRWANAANSYINRTMFGGTHNHNSLPSLECEV